MPFGQEPTKTPSEIGTIRVELKDAIAREDQLAFQAAYFDVEVLYSDGSQQHKHGKLQNVIMPTQRQALMDFMDSLRAQAEAEILP